MTRGMLPSIDTHCHAYPEKIAPRAVQGVGTFYGLPIVCDGRLSTLLARGALCGCVHYVVSSVATTPHQVASINAFAAASMQADPARVTGLGALHPDSEHQEADVESLLALGLRGVKLHPDFQKLRIDDPRFLRIFALCEGRLPVLCHLGDRRYDCSNPARVGRVLRRFPKLTMIGAHLGGWSIWTEAYKQLAEYENLLVDTSSSLYAVSPDEAAAAIRAYGAERVLFGSDFPMWDPVGERARFDALPLTETERARILWENAAALYGIDMERAQAQCAGTMTKKAVDKRAARRYDI